MAIITLVTGNQNKALEYESLLPAGSDTLFKTQKLDLPEIQSLEPEEIVADKLKRAYNIVQAPVIVEDVSAGLESLNGLPGPFIKFFEEKLGATALLQLAQTPGEHVSIVCKVGYYDGRHTSFGTGEIKGLVVEPRGQNGFGFDSVVQPMGSDLTLAEMTSAQKNTVSHRALAIKDLLQQIV